MHVFSHGDTGQLVLGNETIDAGTLLENADQIAGWSAQLDLEADILLYGCNLAATDEGVDFLDLFSNLTGADVAASDNLTGSSALGGDWDLEFRTGAVETNVALSDAVQDIWMGVLSATVDSSSAGSTTSSVLTISHTTSGTERLMIVGVSMDAQTSASVSTVTYNGSALTLVGTIQEAGSNVRVELWQMIAPATGNHDVIVTFTQTMTEGGIAGVVTYNGVDQTTPLGSFASAEGIGTNASVNVSTDVGDLFFSTMGLDGSSDTVLNEGAGQTEYWEIFQPGTEGAGSTKVATSTSETMSWTFASNQWAIGGVAIKAYVPPSVNFTIDSTASISEELAEQSTFNVTLVGDPLVGGNTASVDIVGSGTALSGTDYENVKTAIANAASTTTGVTFDGVDSLTFDSSFNGGTGQGTFSFTLDAIDDIAQEGTETIIATLSNMTVTEGTASFGTVRDSFTEASDTPITSHLSSTGGGWTEVYDSSTATTDATVYATLDVLNAGSDENSVGQAYTGSPSPTSVDQTISFTLSEIDTSPGTKPVGVFGRYVDNDNFYYLQVLPNDNAQDSLQLAKMESGVTTVLGSIDVTIAQGDTFKLEISDAAKKIYFKGTEVISSADNALTAAGEWGLYFGDFNGIVGHLRDTWGIDDFLAEDSASTAIATTLITETDVNNAPHAADDRQGVDFDGIEDHILIGSDTALELTTTLTMEAWINPDESANSGRMIINREGEYEVALAADNTIQWAFANTDPGWAWHNTGVAVEIGEWSHIAVTFDNGDVTTYLNGVQGDFYDGSGTIVDSHATLDEFRIGGRQNNPPNQSFDGRIADVRIWDSARAGVDIAANLNTVFNRSESNLVGYWRLNENSTTALDLAGSNDGTLAINASPSGYWVTEESSISESAPGVLGNDYDVDGNSLTISEVNGSAINVGKQITLSSGALLTLSADGSFNYDTNGAFESLAFEETTTDTFSYTATDGSATDTATVTIQITGVNDTPIVTSAQTFAVDENSSNGTVVGNVVATDADAGTTFSAWAITGGNTGSAFSINASTGQITVADSSAIDYETLTQYTLSVEVTDGINTSTTETVQIDLNDMDEADVSAITDINATFNAIDEDATSGVVGITASASDADGTNNTITYSLTDSASGRFVIDSATGVVSVATSGSPGFDYESATSHDIIVQATSSDGSTSTETFTIAVNDVDEADVGAVTDSNVAANAIDEDATSGVVGITASASDADGTNNAITYSLTDSASGRFAIDSVTGVVSDATSGSPGFDYESATSHDIIVQATSSDGSTSTETFTIAVNDVDEADVSAITDINATVNAIDEDATSGVVGITASASDADGTNNTITYSLTDSASGRFVIDSATGVVSVATSGSPGFDYESATSHDIIVQATSSDGSTSTETFTIAVNDVDEADVSAITDINATVNAIDEDATSGVVGITASASDADGTNNTITYSLTDSASGRFVIDSATGVVSVATSGFTRLRLRERHQSRHYRPGDSSSDGSTSTETFTIAVNDVDEADVGAVTDSNVAANAIDEDATSGVVGITASASDADGTNNAITYSLTDSASGRFVIDSVTGVVSDATSGSPGFDYESATSHDIIVQATSSDGSTSTETFTIAVNDVDEADVSAITDINATVNAIDEDATSGVVGITASASDADGTNNTITYSLTDSASGRFVIDSATGVVSVATSGSPGFDYESATSHDIIVQATSSDGSTSTETFTIAVNDVDEADVGAVTDSNVAANAIDEDATSGVVGITASASDADGTNNAITYSLTDSASGRFVIDSATGVVSVATSGSPGFDYESATSHDIIVQAASLDGSSSIETFTIAVNDVDEADVSAVTDSNVATNAIDEDATSGVVGITASASDADGTNNTITYSLTDNAGGRFVIDSATGVVSVATSGSPGFDYESATSHDIIVQAASADGSTSSETFTIAVNDVDEADVAAVTDSNAAVNAIDEDATSGVVGITASASDADGTNNTITYSLTDSASGRFMIDSATGVVSVATSGSPGFDYESASSHDIIVQAASSDGSTSTETFTIAVNDIDEADVSAVVDSNATTNEVDEDATSGVVGITASASDADGTNNTITFSLTDSASGRFVIDSATGVVSVATSGSPGFDYESATSHDIIVQATSSDGSTSTETFTIAVNDVDEADVGAVTDSNVAANAIDEDATSGVVGITASASDADGTNNAITYSLTDSASGRFVIDSATGVVSVATSGSPGFNYESVSSHDIIVQAASSNGSSSTETFRITVNDVDEADVSAITDINATVNAIDEDATSGVVGITASASDADGTNNNITYSLTDNAGGRFAIDSATGVVSVAISGSPDFDYESAASHDIIIRAESADGSSSTETFTIEVNDLNENAPLITSGQSFTVVENASNGTVVGNVVATDADAGTTLSGWAITGGNTGNAFTINATTGQIIVADSSALDFESLSQYTLSVEVTDGSLNSNTASVQLNITDQKEFVISSISDVDNVTDAVKENSVGSTPAGITASAVDGDGTTNGVIYSLIESANGRFQIDSQTGVVSVADVGSPGLDYETNTSHRITVEAHSSDGSLVRQTFSIAVLNINEAPTLLSESIVIELQFNGQTGSLSAVDPDTGDSIRFDIIGGSARELFKLDTTSGELVPVVGTPPGIYELQVAIADSEGATTSAMLRITLHLNDSLTETNGSISPGIAEESNTVGSTDGSIEQETNAPYRYSSAPTSTAQVATVSPQIVPDQATPLDGNTGDASYIDALFDELSPNGGDSANRSSSGIHTSSMSSMSSMSSTSTSIDRYRVTLKLLLDQTSDSVEALGSAFAEMADLTLPEFDITPQLREALSSMKADLSDIAQLESDEEQIEITVKAGISVTLTSGFLIWLIKSGVLAAATRKTATMWHSFDPIPVLAQGKQDDDKRTVTRQGGGTA